MSGFTGFANLNKDISKDIHIVKNMNVKMKKNAIDEENYYIDTHINLGYIGTLNNKEERYIMSSMKYYDTIYTIVFNGQIYNRDEIMKELKELGYEFTSNLDEELLLKAFIHYATNIVKKLNGVFSFAIWNNKSKELFLVRDHFGIKPLYYTIVDNTLIFATEIKAILEHPKVQVCINKQSICELFGLRPSSYFRKLYF